MNRLTRPLHVLFVVCLLALAAPAAAQASHLQGGYFTANVTSAGHLQGTLTFLYDAGSCTVGTNQGLTFVLTRPGGATQNVPVAAQVTRCLGTAATVRGQFDVDISAFPDGLYELRYSSGDWVNGIQNATGLAMVFTAGVRKSALGATSAPTMASEPSRGIAVGYAYAQNLNASDPDGGTLTYESKVQPHQAAPDSNVIDVSPGGQVTIPASTTAGYANGQRYRYKVRVTDSQGDWVERDVLLTVTNQNVPPAITGLAAAYDAVAGTRTAIDITGTDANGADSVSLAATGLPAWATIQATPGNPASARLVLEPPAGSEGQTAGINLDAVDDNAIAPLMTSGFTSVTVVAPPAAPAPQPEPEPEPAKVTPKLVNGPGGLAGAIEVLGDAADVACAATGATLTSCRAEIRVRGGQASVPGAIVSGNALVASGSRKLAGVSRAELRVRLTKRGKRLVQGTLGGLRVRVTLRARTATGEALTTRRNARMWPERQLVVPTDGLFGVRGTELASEGRALLARIAARLKGAGRVTCIGHADGSATPRYGRALGAARAQVVCAELRRLGFRGRVRSESKGIDEPRASNDTSEGRALNRRVELRIRWAGVR